MKNYIYTFSKCDGFGDQSSASTLLGKFGSQAVCRSTFPTPPSRVRESGSRHESQTWGHSIGISKPRTGWMAPCNHCSMAPTQAFGRIPLHHFRPNRPGSHVYRVLVPRHLVGIDLTREIGLKISKAAAVTRLPSAASITREILRREIETTYEAAPRRIGYCRRWRGLAVPQEATNV